MWWDTDEQIPTVKPMGGDTLWEESVHYVQSRSREDGAVYQDITAV